MRPMSSRLKRIKMARKLEKRDLPSRYTRRKAMQPSVCQVSLQHDSVSDASPHSTREVPGLEGGGVVVEGFLGDCAYLLPATSAVLDGGIGLGFSLFVEDGAAVIVRVRGRGVGDGRGQHRSDAPTDGDRGAAEPSCASRGDGALDVGAMAVVDLLLVVVGGGRGRCVRHDERGEMFAMRRRWRRLEQ